MEYTNGIGNWFSKVRADNAAVIRMALSISAVCTVCFLGVLPATSLAAGLTDSTKTVKCATGFTVTETSSGSKQFYCMKVATPNCTTGFSVSSQTGTDTCIKSEDAKCSESSSVVSYVLIADGGSVTNSQGKKTENVDCGGSNKYCCSKTDGSAVNTTYRCSSSACIPATKSDGKPYCSCSKAITCASGSTSTPDYSGTTDKCVSYKSPTF